MARGSSLLTGGRWLKNEPINTPVAEQHQALCEMSEAWRSDKLGRYTDARSNFWRNWFSVKPVHVDG